MQAGNRFQPSHLEPFLQGHRETISRTDEFIDREVKGVIDKRLWMLSRRAKARDHKVKRIVEEIKKEVESPKTLNPKTLRIAYPLAGMLSRN